MNKKICFILMTLNVMSVHAQNAPAANTPAQPEPAECRTYTQINNRLKPEEKTVEPIKTQLAQQLFACENARARAQVSAEDAAAKQTQANADAAKNAGNGVSTGQECAGIFEKVQAEEDAAKNGQTAAPGAAVAPKVTGTKSHIQCQAFMGLARANSETTDIKYYDGSGGVIKKSMDGKMKCDKIYTYTADYDECEKALAAYNFITNSEAFMNLQQTVRTDVKTANINRDATAAAANGDSQTAMFKAAEETNNHMKQMESEKAIAYSAAVAALGRAYYMIPDEDDVIRECERTKVGKHGSLQTSANCKATVMTHKPYILANQGNKAALFEAIAQFTAKGIAAGIKMKQYGNNAQNIAAAQASIVEDTTDMMIEMCEANPTDPACMNQGNRVSGNSASFGMGEFGLGDGGNNVFGANTDSSEFGEVGAATDLDDKNTVAGINSPFKDDAKKAKDILNPAGAAQTQAQGGAQGGGPGGGAGLGGGGASLGSDLAGADPSADKEAQIKTGKVSGAYNAAGGGGYKGIARGKDDANPFASLFDQKGGGGVEEDRSIASGDIDGKASGLFEKISKRYGQVQADKRVEAKNLE